MFPTGVHSGVTGYEGAPRRWFVHSVFNHKVHREMTCVECHSAVNSTKTADLLQPAKGICMACHSDAGGAPTTCVECHLYHDPAHGRGMEGHLKIVDVRR